MGWISDIFNASEFLPRSHCGPWTAQLQAAYVVGNLGIAAAYFAMPITIMYLWGRRREAMKYPWILLLFASFICLCGITHICDVLTFWWPAYRLYTAISVITAMVSMATAILLPIEVAYLLQARMPEEWRKTIEQLEHYIIQRDSSIKSAEDALAEAKKVIVHLDRMRRTGIWAAAQADHQKATRTEFLGNQEIGQKS